MWCSLGIGIIEMARLYNLGSRVELLLATRWVLYIRHLLVRD
jgi:hypothetical protein